MLSPVLSVTVKMTWYPLPQVGFAAKLTVNRLGFSTAVTAGDAVAISGAEERMAYGGVPPKIR